MHLAIDIDSHAVRAATLDTDGKPYAIALGGGAMMAMPAVVRRTMHGWSVGWDAAQSMVGNSETTVAGCTRLMGRAEQLAPDLKARLPYPVRTMADEVVCNLLYAEVRAGDCYSELLREAVRQAEAVTGERVEDVVLTVPASAEDRLRIQVRNAAEQAGLKVRRLINQPTAALLSADLPPKTKRVLVVHAGQATTDATVAEIGTEKGHRTVRVLATAGDPLLGGDDWVWTMTQKVAEQIQQRAGLDLRQVDGSGVALEGLRGAIQAALPALAFDDAAMLVLDHGGGFGRDIVQYLNRNEVELWLESAMEKVWTLCQRVVNDSKVKHEDIDVILLTGAMAPWTQLQRTIAKVPHKTLMVASPEITVMGAAVAIQDNATIWDVTPYPLGINCFYGDEERFSPIINANTPIPTPKVGEAGAFTESYTTRFVDQTSVRLDILQYRGERVPGAFGIHKVYPHECEQLGSWLFNNLKPPSGRHADFTVTFAIDRDGILRLEAVETATGHRLKAKVDRGIG
jgi:molecular chaperone DnaK